LFTGSFLKVPELISTRGKVITVIPCNAAALEPVEVDGEVIGVAPVCFEVVGDQLNIAVPKL
jgi:diacylglycerol kinase family enzyme